MTVYTKLPEYSNKYMTVYTGKDRLIFDFKHPRLYHRGIHAMFNFNVNSGSTTAVNAISAGGVNIPYNINVGPMSNEVNYLDTFQHSATQHSMVPSEIIECKTLVLSQKSSWGRVYVLDSTGTPLRLCGRDKNLHRPGIFSEMVRFFGQFDTNMYNLAAAAILPKEKISIENLKQFQLLLSQALGTTVERGNYHGYLWSFMYPVLREIKYYEWTERDFSVENNNLIQGGVSHINFSNHLWQRHLRRSRSFSEALRKIFEIEGNEFIKNAIRLSSGEKHCRVIFGMKGNTMHGIHGKKQEIPVTVRQDFINAQMRDGANIKSIPEASHYVLSTSSDFIFNKGTDLAKTERYYTSDWTPFKDPYSTSTFHHFLPIHYFNLFKGLVPIDYWFKLESISPEVAQMTDERVKHYREFIEAQTPAIRKRLFFTFKPGYDFDDVIRQLAEYRNPTNLPEKAKEHFPNGLQIPKKWKDVKELHDMISRDYNKIKAFANWKEIKYLEPILKLDNLDFGDGFTSELPKDTARVTEYGSLLRHCVASYGSRCADNNNTVILSINKNGEPFYTLELIGNIPLATITSENGMINPEEIKYKVRQFKAFQNKVPHKQEVLHIMNGLQATNLIESFSEPRGAAQYNGPGEVIDWNEVPNQEGMNWYEANLENVNNLIGNPAVNQIIEEVPLGQAANGEE